MTIRKIKAHSAEVDNDYVYVEQGSYRTIGAFLGGMIGFIISIISGVNSFEDTMIITCITTILGVFLFKGREVRQIPSVDLVEIKQYPGINRVTVVLDDERTKRRQPVATNKPE